MSKYTRKLEFNAKTRNLIKARDGGCIFCQMGYHMEGALSLDLEVKIIMHYIPRSKLGLGIEQNGAVGCQWHHDMLDNGNKGHRAEMLDLFRGYLKERYPEWSEASLIFCKWCVQEEPSASRK